METQQYKYAILMETSGDMYESWYYFIRHEGNEDALETLSRQLDDVNWKIVRDYSTFDLDIENLVSSQTASEMIRVVLNPTFYHRKFDGTLSEIDLGFESGEKNKTRIKKTNRILGKGKIADYVDGEELVSEDEGSSSGDEAEDTCESDSSSDSSEDSNCECDECGTETRIEEGRLPPGVLL